MSFYHQCLGGDLTLTTLGETPMKTQFPQEMHGRIINAYLKSDGIEISATDWMASPSFNPIQGNTVGIFVVGGTYDELSIVFDKLKEGANKEQFIPIMDMPFGTYGHFYDKFGVPWFFKGDKK